MNMSESNFHKALGPRGFLDSRKILFLNSFRNNLYANQDIFLRQINLASHFYNINMWYAGFNRSYLALTYLY